jgi:hypothetical protein
VVCFTPSASRRVQSVSEDIRFYPKKEHGADTGHFDKIKRLVVSVPPAKLKPAAALNPVQAKLRQGLQRGFADLHARDFTIAFPGRWGGGQAEAGRSLFIVPEGGVTKKPNGGIELSPAP